ncbi:MAG: aspartate aminotransferase family protein [Proteobacteria bacterium]|nr:aspartate aminotransferase family protein [Pseudomonadota bacterium]
MLKDVSAPRANLDLASAVQDAEAAYVAAHPKSAELARLAQQQLPGGNTRTTVYFTPFPFYVESGKGSTLLDADGHTYIDFVNEFTAGLFGHSNEVLIQSLIEIVQRGYNYGAPTRYEALFAAEVRRRFPAMELVRFCNSGTEADMLAMAVARSVTGKEKVMIFDSAYHGGLFSFGAQPAPLNMPVPFIKSVFNDIAAVTQDIRAHAGELAAVIVEPLQGGAGVIPGSEAFLKALRSETEKNGVLLIFDEVMTSRTGFGGIQGRYGITPDLVTLGKYLAGGITIGAFGGRADLMQRFDPSQPGAFPHGGTFNNNVLAMALGHVALSKVLTPEASAAMNARGDRLRDALNELSRKNGVAMLASGLGSIFGLHFHKGPLRNAEDIRAAEKSREAATASLKKLFQFDMLKAGFYISRRIMGCLSLANSDQDVDSFIAAVDEFQVSRKGLITSVVAP